MHICHIGCKFYNLIIYSFQKLVANETQTYTYIDYKGKS